jgi:hypothetical protein
MKIINLLVNEYSEYIYCPVTCSVLNKIKENG